MVANYDPDPMIKHDQLHTQWKITKVLSFVIGAYLVTYVPAGIVSFVAIDNHEGMVMATTTIIWNTYTFVTSSFMDSKLQTLQKPSDCY